MSCPRLHPCVAATIKKKLTIQWPLEKRKKGSLLEAVCACAPVRIIHVPQSHSAPVVSLVFLLSSLIRPPDPQSPSCKTPWRRLIDFPSFFLLCACEAAAAAAAACVSAGRESKEEKKSNLKLISAGLRMKIEGGCDKRRREGKKKVTSPQYAAANTEEMRSALPLSTPPHFPSPLSSSFRYSCTLIFFRSTCDVRPEWF